MDLKAWATAKLSTMAPGELLAMGVALILGLYFLVVTYPLLYRYTVNSMRIIKYLIFKSIAIFITPLAHLFYYEIPANDYLLFNDEIGNVLEKTKVNRFISIIIFCVRLPIALLFMVKHSIFASFLWIGETLTLFMLFPFSTSLTVERVTQSSWMYFYPNSLFNIEQASRKLRSWVTGSRKNNDFYGIRHQLIARIFIFPIIAIIILVIHSCFLVVETLAFLLFYLLKRTIQLDQVWRYPLSLKSLKFKLTLLRSWSLDRLEMTQNFTSREDEVIGRLLQSLVYLTLVLFLLFISHLIISGSAIQQIRITLHEDIFQDHLQDGSLGPEMVIIPDGKFQMGDIQDEKNNYEQPHWVTIERFAIGRYEVTFAEYDVFAEDTGRNKPNDNGWGRENRPVINVSWYDAVAYTTWLSQQTGQNYRLPTEAEWEYAARAGTKTVYWWGNEIGIDHANCISCGSRWDGKSTAPVGFFPCNAFRLCDTVGNVWEWTCSAPSNYDEDKELHCATASEHRRVMRGGSYLSDLERVRSAARGSSRALKASHSWGFRVVSVR